MSISLGFAAKFYPQTSANMDQQSLSIPHPAGPTAAHTGPEGLEGPTQSGLDLRKTCQSHQQLLEVFKESHAQSQRKLSFTYVGRMIRQPYQLHSSPNIMNSIFILQLACISTFCTKTVCNYVQVMYEQMCQGNFRSGRDVKKMYHLWGKKVSHPLNPTMGPVVVCTLIFNFHLYQK